MACLSPGWPGKAPAVKVPAQPVQPRLPSPPGVKAQLVAAKCQPVQAAGAAAGVHAASPRTPTAFATLVPAQQLAGQGSLLLVVLHPAHPLVQLSVLVDGGLQGGVGRRQREVSEGPQGRARCVAPWMPDSTAGESFWKVTDPFKDKNVAQTGVRVRQG